MPRIAILGVTLLLAGCGYNTWWNPPFFTGPNPTLPVNSSENMNRVMGMGASVQPLTPEPGDVWPGPMPVAPTLQDIETSSGATPQPEQPVPGSPQQLGTQPGSVMTPQ